MSGYNLTKQGHMYLHLYHRDIRLASVAHFRTRYLPSTSLITASANLFGREFRTRININIFQISWEKRAARNASSALALLLSLDAKLVNNFHKKSVF
jgi:hypothetical protein